MTENGEGMVAGPEAEWSHCSHTQEAEGEQEVRPGSKVSSPDPDDPLPPARLHSLNVPQPFQ